MEGGENTAKEDWQNKREKKMERTLKILGAAGEKGREMLKVYEGAHQYVWEERGGGWGGMGDDGGREGW